MEFKEYYEFKKQKILKCIYCDGFNYSCKYFLPQNLLKQCFYNEMLDKDLELLKKNKKPTFFKNLTDILQNDNT